MLTLFSMIMAAYAYCIQDLKINQRWTPMPVVVEAGNHYDYNEIDDAITVPANWNDSCYNQRMLLLQMINHFNNFRNGQQKLKSGIVDDLSRKWVCVK